MDSTVLVEITKAIQDGDFKHAAEIMHIAQKAKPVKYTQAELSTQLWRLKQIRQRAFELVTQAEYVLELNELSDGSLVTLERKVTEVDNAVRAFTMLWANKGDSDV